MSTPQAPLPSGFSWETTADEALDSANLKGCTIIITGAARGIGLEAARVLSNAGAEIVAPVRDPNVAPEALKALPNLSLAQIDLADPASIDRFAESFLASNRPLHRLVNNAGVMACPLTRDARGYEMQFAVNHLGHFQLTARLWPALAKAKGARVVTLSSGAHRRCGVDFDDIHYQRRDYDKYLAYGQSKTANVLFTVGLDARGEKHGVRAFAVHPGVVPDTNLSHFLAQEEIDAARNLVGPPKTIPQGAATTVWCVAHSALEGKGGVYCEDVDIAEAAPAEKTTPGGVRPWAIDPQLADRLWRESEEMTGVRFSV